jgi:O-antigen/teichoic acid export membrane protein
MHKFFHSLHARSSSSTWAHRLIKGSSWSLLGTIASRLASIVSTILLARLVGQQVFGEYGIILGTIGLLGVFAGFGLSLTGAKHVAEFRSSDPARAGRIIAMTLRLAWCSSAVLGLALFVFSESLSSHVLGAPHLDTLLAAAIPMLILQTVIGAQSGIMSGFEAFRLIFRNNTAIGILAAALLLGGVWLDDLRGALLGTAFAYAAHVWLNQAVINGQRKKYGIPVPKSFTSELSLAWRFSLPSMLGNIAILTAIWLGNVVLVNKPDGYREMGIYTAANQWFNAMIILPNLIGQVALPILSERRSANDARGYRRLWLSSIGINAACVLPVVLVGAFASEFIMSAYGKDFAGTHGVLVMMLLAGALYAVLNAAAQLLVQEGRMWMVCFSNLGWSVVFVTCAHTLVNSGAMGLAQSRFLAYLVHSLWIGGLAYYLMRTSTTLKPQTETI